jgi:hypothetical protein
MMRCCPGRSGVIVSFSRRVGTARHQITQRSTMRQLQMRWALPTLRPKIRDIKSQIRQHLPQQRHTQPNHIRMTALQLLNK